MKDIFVNIEKANDKSYEKMAWRTSFIPFIGIPAYLIFALLAIINNDEIHKKFLLLGFIQVTVISIFASIIVLSGAEIPDEYTLVGNEVIKTTFYNSKNKESEGPVDNNIPNGKWTYWYENGQKKREGILDYNIERGKWTYWNKNGTKIKEEYYYIPSDKLFKGMFYYGYRESIHDKTVYYKNNKPEIEDIFDNTIGSSLKKRHYFNNKGEIVKIENFDLKSNSSETTNVNPPKRINWDTYLKEYEFTENDLKKLQSTGYKSRDNETEKNPDPEQTPAAAPE